MQKNWIEIDGAEIGVEGVAAAEMAQADGPILWDWMMGESSGKAIYKTFGDLCSGVRNVPLLNGEIMDEYDPAMVNFISPAFVYRVTRKAIQASMLTDGETKN